MEQDRIDSLGYPLCFPLPQTDAPAGLVRVQARALGGHQKEAVVCRSVHADPGAPAAVNGRYNSWRLVSDEGPGLGGTDLAPFPLGFWNAGLAADLLEQFACAAREAGVAIDSVQLASATDYAFSGSFFAGTGTGEAIVPRLDWTISSSAPGPVLAALVRMALDRSMVIAFLRTPLVNRFALQVNGRALRLRRLTNVPEGDTALDPLKHWRGRPAPPPGWSAQPALIERLTPESVRPMPIPATTVGSAPVSASAAGPVSTSARLPGESRRLEIRVRGLAQSEPHGTRAEVFFDGLALSRFAIRAAGETDGGQTPVRHRGEAPTGERSQAPTGLALAMSGVAFCLMTQVLRYVEYRKLNLRGLRLVQTVPSSCADDGRAMPLSTHVFVHGDETEQTMEALLEMSANTCYLHAALGARLDPLVSLNGVAITPASVT